MKNKILILALVMLLVIGCFVSCGNKNNDTDTDSNNISDSNVDTNSDINSDSNVDSGNVGDSDSNVDSGNVGDSDSNVDSGTPDVPKPAEKYQVTFDADGGSAVASQEVESGKTATAPTAPEKTGYTFAGWLLNGEAYDFATLVTADIELVANWTINKYTVSFDIDGIEDQVVDYNTVATAPDAPTKEGYTFAGWLLNGEAYDFATPVTADIELVADWTINKYTVTFDANGGLDVDAKEVEHGSAVEAPETPVYVGYVFVKWHIDTVDGEEYDFETPVTGDLTLVAEWIEAEYPCDKGGNCEFEVKFTTDVDCGKAQDGIKETVCTKCGAVKEGTVPEVVPYEHTDAGVVDTVNVTCGADGYVVHSCSVCEQNYNVPTGEARPAHTFDEYADGRRVCTVCQNEYRDITAVETQKGQLQIDENTYLNWELIKYKESADAPMALAAGEATVIYDAESAKLNCSILGLTGEAAYTVVIEYADGEATITAEAGYVDLYAYSGITKVTVTATAEATVSVYALMA